MSWCPKCRSEYISGRETCADCGSVLVESLDDINDEAKDMFDFDSLSDDMKRRVLNELKKENLDPNIVLNNSAKEGTPEYIAQIIQEENAPSYEEYEAEAAKAEQEEIRLFIKKEDKYKDYRSTGYTFLIVGVLGLLFVIAEFTGILDIFNFSAGSNYIFTIVMSLMFIIFIFVGIISFKSCKKLKTEAETENNYISALESWISDNISSDKINEGINQSLDTDALYEKRSQKIRSMLLSHDADMDKSMLEHYVENTYIALFES